MKLPVVFYAEARAETNAAFRWYENQRRGAGEEFVLAVEETLERIVELPLSFPLVDEDIRRAAVHRFPFGVFFSVAEERITVIAIFHAKRNPQEWQDRK